MTIYDESGCSAGFEASPVQTSREVVIDKFAACAEKYADAADRIALDAVRIANLEAKLATANALVTCCCGNPVDTHGMGDGHSPVDMYHYAHMRMTEQNERLKNLLCLADDVLMLSHGCFPSDRVTDEQRYLNDAAKAIRTVTGEDFHERKRLAALALGGK